MKDFFWDDEFRPKWDPMLSYFKTLEECPVTGEMIVHWIKKVNYHRFWIFLSGFSVFCVCATCLSLSFYLLKSVFAVPFFLQWSRVYHEPTHMGVCKNLLLCHKGIVKHIPLGFNASTQSSWSCWEVAYIFVFLFTWLFFKLTPIRGWGSSCTHELKCSEFPCCKRCLQWFSI